MTGAAGRDGFRGHGGAIPGIERTAPGCVGVADAPHRLATRIGRQQAHEHLRTISTTAKDRRISLRDALQLDLIWQEHGDDTVLDLGYLGRSEQIVTTVVRSSREWAAQLAVAAEDLAAAEPDNLRRLLRNAGVADPA